MMKRVLAVLLCLCMLVPTMGLTLGQVASAAGGYVIAELPYQVAGISTVNNGILISHGVSISPAINLRSYGYPGSGVISAGKIGLSFDLFVSGKTALANALHNGSFGGQIELSSGGSYDEQERWCSVTTLDFVKDGWNRCVVDLSRLSNSASATNPSLLFNPSNLNYMRIYIQSLGSYNGQSVSLKICNVRLVDLTKTAPSVTADPVGDGTFVAKEPVWAQHKVASGYREDEIIVAGYNLADYVKNNNLNVTDYAGVINSLLDRLALAGGGALFIPAGEYDCYSEIVVPTGTSIYGEWKQPDGASKISGTILKVHKECGAGNADGTPFVTQMPDSLVKGLAFWYPEQTSFSNPTAYPPTILLDTSTHAKNITLVNAYQGIITTVTKASPLCPNMENVYGTPLYRGIDIDQVVDIMRIENVNFAPDYWINSGLACAPSSTANATALKNMLYSKAVGITLRRIDWSYLVFSSVKGYHTGLMFTKSKADNDYPNGQCNGLTLEGCQYGLFAHGVSQFGEMITNSTIKNCTYGIWIDDAIEGIERPSSMLQVTNTDIAATNTAVYNRQKTTVMLTGSTIRSGKVVLEGGWATMTANKFHTAAPQVVLKPGASSAAFVGNKTAAGAAISIDNQGLSPVSVDNSTVSVPAPASLTKDEAAALSKKPTNTGKVVVATFSANGTDITSALQSALNTLGSTGGVLYLPAGHYRLNGSVTVPSGVELRGACDWGRMPYNVGTVLDVYATTSSNPSVILKEKSGIRGIVFNYPEQYRNQLFQTQQKFTEYPYAVQGQGKDIYVMNVAFRNAWNGLDLMTYRCDNHYVDYVSGVAIQNFIKVGKGATGGIIRNYQYNYYTISWEAKFGWGTLPLATNTFTGILNKQFNNNDTTIACLVGDVTDQLIYNNFNYAGHTGLKFVAESTGAANAKVIGHGVDYSTVCIDIQAAENLQFLNTQLTSFNQIGSALTYDMYSIRLGSGFGGTVNMHSSVMWADCTQEFRVQNGTLNMYGVVCFPSHTGSEIANVTGGGKLNLTNTIFTASVNTLLAPGTNGSGVYVHGGLHTNQVADSASAARFANMLHRVDTWEGKPYAAIDFTTNDTNTNDGVGVASNGEFKMWTNETARANVVSCSYNGARALKVQSTAIGRIGTFKIRQVLADKNGKVTFLVRYYLPQANAAVTLGMGQGTTVNAASALYYRGSDATAATKPANWLGELTTGRWAIAEFEYEYADLVPAGATQSDAFYLFGHGVATNSTPYISHVVACSPDKVDVVKAELFPQDGYVAPDVPDVPNPPEEEEPEIPDVIPPYGLVDFTSGSAATNDAALFSEVTVKAGGSILNCTYNDAKALRYVTPANNTWEQTVAFVVAPNPSLADTNNSVTVMVRYYLNGQNGELHLYGGKTTGANNSPYYGPSGLGAKHLGTFTVGEWAIAKFEVPNYTDATVLWFGGNGTPEGNNLWIDKVVVCGTADAAVVEKVAFSASAGGGGGNTQPPSGGGDDDDEGGNTQPPSGGDDDDDEGGTTTPPSGGEDDDDDEPLTPPATTPNSVVIDLTTNDQNSNDGPGVPSDGGVNFKLWGLGPRASVVACQYNNAYALKMDSAGVSQIGYFKIRDGIKDANGKVTFLVKYYIPKANADVTLGFGKDGNVDAASALYYRGSDAAAATRPANWLGTLTAGQWAVAEFEYNYADLTADTFNIFGHGVAPDSLLYISHIVACSPNNAATMKAQLLAGSTTPPAGGEDDDEPVDPPTGGEDDDDDDEPVNPPAGGEDDDDDDDKPVNPPATTPSYAVIDFTTNENIGGGVGNPSDGTNFKLWGLTSGSVSSAKVEACTYNNAYAIKATSEGVVQIGWFRLKEALKDANGKVTLLVNYYIPQANADVTLGFGQGGSLDSAAAQYYRGSDATAATKPAGWCGTLTAGKWAVAQFDYDYAEMSAGGKSMEEFVIFGHGVAPNSPLYISHMVACSPDDADAVKDYLFPDSVDSGEGNGGGTTPPPSGGEDDDDDQGDTPVDTTELKALIAQKVELNGVDQALVGAYNAALEAAEAAVSATTPNADTVAAATAALQKAIDDIAKVIAAAKAELQAAVDAAIDDLSGYTEASAKVYTDALTMAKAVLSRPNATVQSYANALSALKAAERGLTVVTPAPTYTLGDANDNNEIDSADALLVLQYYAKIDGAADKIDLNAADVDRDGDIDSSDALYILQFYAKIITEFPAAKV